MGTNTILTDTSPSLNLVSFELKDAVQLIEGSWEKSLLSTLREEGEFFAAQATTPRRKGCCLLSLPKLPSGRECARACYFKISNVNKHIYRPQSLHIATRGGGAPPGIDNFSRSGRIDPRNMLQFISEPGN